MEERSDRQTQKQVNMTCSRHQLTRGAGASQVKMAKQLRMELSHVKPARLMLYEGYEMLVSQHKPTVEARYAHLHACIRACMLVCTHRC